MFHSLTGLCKEAIKNFQLLFRFKDGPKEDIEDEGESIQVGIHKPVNPIKLLSNLEPTHWLALGSGCLAIYADLLDFSLIGPATRSIAKDFQTTKAHVSDSITYTLLLRCVGAIVFGFLGDFYGRRWPLIFNLLLLGCLQIITIYSKTITIFIAIRSIFGLAMGGVFALAISQIYDLIPIESRGLVGGLFGSCASAAGMTGAGLNMAFGVKEDSWKKMFWVSVAISFFAAFVRFLLPESPQFIKAVRIKKEEKGMRIRGNSNHLFFTRFYRMFKLHWKTFVYCILFVSLPSWGIHTINDNFITFLTSGKGFDNKTASVIAMIFKSGSFLGHIVVGWLGEFVGRRRMAIMGAIFGAILLPAAMLPSSVVSLCIGGWFFSFLHEGYGAIIAAHLNELSPKEFRAIIPGVAFQLGNTIASPAAMIVNKLAEKRHITLNGKRVEAYQPVILYIMEIIFFLMIIIAAFGPERRGVDLKHFKPAGLSESENRIRLDEFKNIDSTQTQIKIKPEFE